MPRGAWGDELQPTSSHKRVRSEVVGVPLSHPQPLDGTFHTTPTCESWHLEVQPSMEPSLVSITLRKSGEGAIQVLPGDHGRRRPPFLRFTSLRAMDAGPFSVLVIGIFWGTRRWTRMGIIIQP